MRRKPVVRGPTTSREPVAVKTPAVLLGEEGNEARDTASEPDAVDDARVRGIGDDHFVPGIHGAEESVEKRLHSARSDHDLALGVIAMAAPLGGEVGDRRAQVEVAGERKPLFDFGSSSLLRVTSSASGGSGRSVSRFSMRRMGPPWLPPVSSATAATRSIPKPRIGCIRSARLITNLSLLPGQGSP